MPHFGLGGLRSALKRRFKITGPHNMTRRAVELTSATSSPSAKPGVVALTWPGMIITNTVLAIVALHPDLQEGAEVTGPTVLEPGMTYQTITWNVRPLSKDLDLSALPYVARLYLDDTNFNLGDQDGDEGLPDSASSDVQNEGTEK